MNQKNFRLKTLAEGGMLAAIAVILAEFVKIPLMPNGGSVTLGSMIPVFVFSYRHGWKKGVFLGVVCGALQLLFGQKYSLHPLSILCDYIIPFGIMGFISLFGRTLPKCIVGILVLSAIRFVSHTISGMVVFATPFWGSITYNLTYVVPEAIILIILMAVLMKPLEKYKILSPVHSKTSA